MNLDRLTEEQRLSVMKVKGPLLISAGAGSGKTFTLTQRIAYALLTAHESGIRDIDEILAITFTDKAAGEIKARVKSTLRQEGLAEQALKVDAAWISTIHGMCARMLRTHAFELGIDPGFGVIGDAERSDLLMQAINEALGDGSEFILRDHYQHLFAEFPARSASRAVVSVASMLEALLNAAANSRGGLEGLSFGPPPLEVGGLIRDLLLAYEKVMTALEEGGSSASAEKARSGTEEALTRLQDFLLQAESVNFESAASLIEELVFLPRNFGNAHVKASVGEFQEEYARIAYEILLGLVFPAAEELRTLAYEVNKRYEAKKAEVFVLDNDDLLNKTLCAFEMHPHIAALYAQQFKLLMVDEFQDTNQTQIDIIEKIAGDHNAKLCTVGDAQQSIYRFRGADVRVYEEHKRKMSSPEVGALRVELSKNFRSHRDVLCFVDRIFEQERVFGDDFMSLCPDEKRPSRYQSSSPRIDVVLTVRPGGNRSGVSATEGKRSEARAIAQRFAALREAGHDAGEMVVLLGSMTRAEVYAQALRHEGFECVITGGSSFDKAPEVHTIARLLEALANPAYNAALFEVVTSEMFAFSAEDLLDLTTDYNEKTATLYRCDLYKGFFRMAHLIEEECDATIPLRLHHAVKVLEKAWSDVGKKSVSSIIKYILIESGWITRLQNKGTLGRAQAGNILKALRIIEDLERDQNRGIAQVAQTFSAYLELGLKEAPGALNGEGGHAVRIMTIHASKGLEFPLVALGDFYGMHTIENKLLIELSRGHAYASLAGKESEAQYPLLAKRSKGYEGDLTDDVADLFNEELLEGKSDPLRYRMLIKQRIHASELAELRRRLYVGLTRASEALIVSIGIKDSRKDPLAAYKDVVEDIRVALCGEADFPSGSAELAYGGSQAASFERILLSADEEDMQEEGEQGASVEKSISNEKNLRLTQTPLSEEEKFFIPVLEKEKPLYCESFSPLRQGVFSYSSLSALQERGASQTSEKAVLVQKREEEGYAAQYEGSDTDKATNLGLAFHRLAQYAIETGGIPTESRYEETVHSLALSSAQALRLSEALDRWFASTLFERVYSYAQQEAEIPFFIPLEEGWMEGEIDLLCTNSLTEPAFVIDYKTGGSKEEEEGALHEKHLLQARCYAYAVLKQGYPRVDLYFVRVEHQNKEGLTDPDFISYSFTQENFLFLEQYLIESFRAVIHI